MPKSSIGHNSDNHTSIQPPPENPLVISLPFSSQYSKHIFSKRVPHQTPYAFLSSSMWAACLALVSAIPRIPGDYWHTSDNIVLGIVPNTLCCYNVFVDVLHCRTFYRARLLALCPIPQAGWHILSSVLSCVFSLFVAALYVGGYLCLQFVYMHACILCCII